MRQIRNLSEKWIEEFCECYNAKQPILFEAYINYYGEEYREEIIKKIDDVPYFFLLSDVAYLNSENIPNDDYAREFIKYFKHNKRVLDSMARRGATDSQILSKAIEQSMLKKYPRGSFEYYLHEEFISKPSSVSTHFDKDGTNPIIILPIYFISDRIIFHELNHVLTTPESEENLFPSEEVDELLNELASRDIHEIFKKLGGDKILPYELETGEIYGDKLFLMRDFYEKFKSLIKTCTIKKDIKILEEALGKENLRLYFALTKKLYHQKYITDVDLSRIKFLIWRMEEYYKTKKDCYKRIKLKIKEY